MYSDIQLIWNFIKAEDSVIEVRILNSPRGTMSGYYDDPEKLMEDIKLWDGSVPAIYVTLNPVNKDLQARSWNRLSYNVRTTTSDRDIAKRRCLLIDVDPRRASGISSTDEEHSLAIEKVKEMAEWFSDQGWPDPIIADSGNGGHLLYRTNLPNNEESQKLIANCLQVSDLIFSDEAVEVDQTVHNAARISKLYGTMSCKGDNTPERPHRRSGILYCPEEIKPVTQEQLEQHARMLPPANTMDIKTDHNNDEFDLENWMSENGIHYVLKKDWQGGILYVLANCPFNAEHTNKSAFIIQKPNGDIYAGCHHNSCQGKGWYDLRKKIDPEWTEPTHDEKKNQAAELYRIAKQYLTFKDQNNYPYATIQVNDHKENCMIKSKTYKLFLMNQYTEKTGKLISPDAVTKVVGVMESQAIFGVDTRKLGLRIVMYDNEILYDLGDHDWTTVHISSEKWYLQQDEFPKFKRYVNTAPQAIPEGSGHKLEELLRYVNLRSARDQVLFLVYVVSCFVPDIAHPLVNFYGSKGAAKTTALRVLRRIVDPAFQDLYVMPNSIDRMVLILAQNYLPSFDNLEAISSEQSNILCQASTGGGISKRELYTDRDEVIISFKHPVALNAINQVIIKPDLLDRTIILELEGIDPKDRKEESVFWASFEAVLPEILGSIFDVLCSAVRIFPHVDIEELPRMADFSRWGYAIAEAMGIKGQSFLEYYRENIDMGNETAIDNNPVASAMMILMAERNCWEGAMANLLLALGEVAQNNALNRESKSWPKAANTLGRKLNAVRANLTEKGITYSIAKITSGPSKGRTGIKIANDQVPANGDGDLSVDIQQDGRDITLLTLEDNLHAINRLVWLGGDGSNSEG